MCCPVALLEHPHKSKALRDFAEAAMRFLHVRVVFVRMNEQAASLLKEGAQFKYFLGNSHFVCFCIKTAPIWLDHEVM